jgi:endonuclease III
MMDIKGEVLKLKTYSQELGLDLEQETDRFKWFLASILFAKRISSEVAKRTYREFEKQGIVTPDSIVDAGWDTLVEVLDSGGYVRYDFSTASKLLDIAANLRQEYV